MFKTLKSELCVQNSCVQPAAMSSIRIGKAEYGYVYTYVGGGVYKCQRCSDWGDKDSEVLWLMKGGNDVWYAFDGPKNVVPNSPAYNKAVFISAAPDALMPGNHQWTMVKWDNRKGYFETTQLG